MCQARLGTESTQSAIGTTSLTLNTWFHVCGVILYNSGTQTYSEIIYTNGGDKQSHTNTGGTPTSPPTAFNTTAGLLKRDATGELFWGGSLADCAIWNVQLTDFEILALSKGARPYTIRPGNVKIWWPLDGLASPEPDLSGSLLNGTVTGAAQAFGPPFMQFTPRWPQGGIFPVFTYVLMPQIVT
jgi:hypothetical protein